MQVYLLNLYEIKNVRDLPVAYRFLDIDGILGADREDGDLVDRNLSLLVKQIAYQERAPVALIRQNGKPLIAIPSDLTLSKDEYALTPDVVSLRPRDEVYRVEHDSVSHSDSLVCQAFLRFSLSSPFMNDDQIWSSRNSAFFHKTPVNYQDDRRDVDVYEGFAYRMIETNARLYLSLRLVYRYVDSAWLVDRFDASGIRAKKMRHALYHFGNRWYPVQLLDLLGKGIKETKFALPDGRIENVYDYTLAKAGHNPPNWVRSLRQDTPAIAYQYPGGGRRSSGAASLCKLMLTTADPGVREVHELSIRPPHARFDLTNTIARDYLSRADLGGVPIKISTMPLAVEPKWFFVPEQRFGQDLVLSVSKRRGDDGIALNQLGPERMRCLLNPNGGLAVAAAFGPQFLIVPLSLERRIAEDFQARIEKTVRVLAKMPYKTELVVYDDTNCRTLKSQVDAITTKVQTAARNGGHAILVLPEGAKPDLHNFIERKLHTSVQTQCVTAFKLCRFYQMVPDNGRARFEVPQDQEQKYTSYLRYTAIGLMIVNRQWPWVLETRTRYDAYIGIDVLHHTAAFTFFYDGGRRCFVRLASSTQREKLSRKQVKAVVLTNLRQDLKDGLTVPRTLVVRRDGRVFESEWLGFEDAIKTLIGEGLLPQDISIGAVEVHKNSALGLRLVEEKNGKIENARIGSWFALDDTDGIVCTTGFPFRLRGTANPLHVRIARGKLDIVDILEDTFAMSQLCWPVPDRCMRLSIDLKLCDDFLGSIASEADDDDAIYGDDAREASEDFELTETQA
jgi:hypothetical protein